MHKTVKGKLSFLCKTKQNTVLTIPSAFLGTFRDQYFTVKPLLE